MNPLRRRVGDTRFLRVPQVADPTLLHAVVAWPATAATAAGGPEKRASLGMPGAYSSYGKGHGQPAGRRGLEGAGEAGVSGEDDRVRRCGGEGLRSRQDGAVCLVMGGGGGARQRKPIDPAMYRTEKSPLGIGRPGGPQAARRKQIVSSAGRARPA